MKEEAKKFIIKVNDSLLSKDVNIAWRKDEGIYNFYFNNCILPTNYVFCPSNKVSWIKQIIK